MRRRGQDMAGPVELHVFDFDNTLFRSPERPEGWERRGWWSYPESLDPPCVPAEPGPDWWNASVLQDARDSIGDEGTHTLLLTGRLEDRFADRIAELVAQQALEFDEIRLTPSGIGTLPFKRGRSFP